MNTNSLTPKQQRKREKIIGVALKLFVKFGIQGTSMQLLAKRADVSTGSIYNYFENKDALIRTIYLQIIDEERDYILVGYDENSSIYKRFEHLVYRSVRAKTNDPDKFHFRKKYSDTPGVMGDLQERDNFVVHPFAKLALDGQKEGIIKQKDLEELLYFASSGMSGFIDWKLFSGKAVTDEDIAGLTEILWDAISVQQGNK